MQTLQQRTNRKFYERGFAAGKPVLTEFGLQRAFIGAKKKREQAEKMFGVTGLRLCIALDAFREAGGIY